MDTEEEFDEQEFTEIHRNLGKQRAIELLVCALIKTHPDPKNFQDTLDALIETEAVFFSAEMKAAYPELAHHVRSLMESRMAGVREKSEQIVNSTVDVDFAFPTRR